MAACKDLVNILARLSQDLTSRIFYLALVLEFVRVQKKIEEICLVIVILIYIDMNFFVCSHKVVIYLPTFAAGYTQQFVSFLECPPLPMDLYHNLPLPLPKSKLKIRKRVQLLCS